VKKEAIFSNKLPKSAGPFSPAIRTEEFVFISGQIGQDPATGALVSGGIEQQAEQAFVNLSHVLSASGKTFNDIVRVGVYLTDMKKFATMNAIYAKYFTEPYPARTTIAVAALPLGAEFEIDAVARI